MGARPHRGLGWTSQTTWGALAIDVLASAALLIAIDGARRHRRGQMTVATIGTMGALLSGVGGRWLASNENAG